MCLQAQGIDSNEGSVGGGRWAQGLSGNYGGVERGRGIDDMSEGLERTTEVVGDRRQA